MAMTVKLPLYLTAGTGEPMELAELDVPVVSTASEGHLGLSLDLAALRGGIVQALREAADHMEAMPIEEWKL
jgi:hypothetical protein